MFVDCAEALRAAAFDRPAAARAEPRLSTDLRQAGDDRCGAAAVLWAMNDLTAKIRMREAVVELFAEVGYANEVGPRRAQVLQ